MLVPILPHINSPPPPPKFILIGTYRLQWYIAWFKQVIKIAQNRNIYLPPDHIDSRLQLCTPG